MAGTIILSCKCSDDFQDREYGRGRRVHNIGGKGKGKVAYCTVCSPSTKRIRRYFTSTEAAPMFGVTYRGIYGPAPIAGGKNI